MFYYQIFVAKLGLPQAANDRSFLLVQLVGSLDYVQAGQGFECRHGRDIALFIYQAYVYIIARNSADCVMGLA